MFCKIYKKIVFLHILKPKKTDFFRFFGFRFRFRFHRKPVPMYGRDRSVWLRWWYLAFCPKTFFGMAQKNKICQKMSIKKKNLCQKNKIYINLFKWSQNYPQTSKSFSLMSLKLVIIFNIDGCLTNDMT